MAIVFEDPFRQLQEELERMLTTGFGPAGPAGGVYPPVNVFDRSEEFLVKAELPGVAPEHIDVSVEGDTLTLRGERTVATPAAEAAYHRRERDGGQFRRVVRLSGRLVADDVRAEYREGVLTVHVPKAKELKARRVDIHVD